MSAAKTEGANAAADEFLEEAKALAGMLHEQAEAYGRERDEPMFDSPSVARILAVVVERICKAQKALERARSP